jgi:hypothetical protein
VFVLVGTLGGNVMLEFVSDLLPAWNALCTEFTIYGFTFSWWDVLKYQMIISLVIGFFIALINTRG